MENEQIQQASEKIKKLGYFDTVHEVVMAFECLRDRCLYLVEITDSHEENSKTRYAVWVKNMNGTLNRMAMCAGAPDIATALTSMNWSMMHIDKNARKD